MDSSPPSLADLDLAPAFRGDRPYAEIVARFAHADLVRVVGDLYDAMDAIVADAGEPAATFVPKDPASDDPDGNGWTIGHLVAHVTAGLEEAAANGVTLARGVETGDRLRFETPWELLDSMAKVRQRLAESRRMTLGFLQAWPDRPNLSLTTVTAPRLGPVNAVGRQLLGIGHGRGHLDQLREVVRQARA